MIGTLLHQRYRIDSELGRGGMGVVYCAHDTLLQRDVAVKVMAASDLGTEGRSRLLHEARAAAALNHPNIVTVHDVGEADGSPFIVMELVEGVSLHDLKVAGGRRVEAVDDILTIARQVCIALEHAHAHGVIHRDLKPENVLLAPDGTAKLMDFGLARSVASRLTSEGTIVGTVFYLAPELALGQGFDGRADLYALGVMLYELTAGRLPFTADDPLAVISQHLHAAVVPPRARNDQIPPTLDALILRLLSKDPEQRPGSAAEVLRVLGSPDILDREATPAEELSVLQRFERGRMVGRDHELQQARALWNRVLSGQGQMLLISGEPGVGKTRLMREIAAHATVSGGRAFVGACYAEGYAPYAAFGQVVRRAFQLNGDEDLRLPDFVMADLLTLAPSLRISYPDVPPNPTLDPQSEQQRLFENVVAFCRVLSERTPLLLAVDDVHWADSGTLSLLRHLARRTRRQRVLLLGTYREVELDEARPFNQVLLDLNRERLATRLKLKRLNREQTHEMLAVLFAQDITPEFLDGIYRETDGNPYFIEEVCKALVESGKLYFKDGRWHRPSIEELEIPQSVRVAIQSRVEKLPFECQETLRMAAILGREFDFDTLAEASELDEDTLIDALESAEKDQLIEEVSSEGSVSFVFAHALIPTTLAEGVRTLRRRRLHRRAAAAIERLRPDDLEALAYHYGEAGNEELALTYYTRAGERASAAYANQEAVGHFRTALDLVRSRPDQAHLLSELGVVLARQSHYKEAIETWREGIELYRSLGELEGIARLYARSARAAWNDDNTPLGLELCREGMSAVAGAPDSLEMANLVHETARACHFNGLPDEATSLCRQALALAERLGAVRVQAEALTTLAILPGQPPEEALAALTQAVELAESAGLLAEAARAHNNLAGLLYGSIGDPQAARDHFARAAELSRQRGAVAQELFYAASVTALGVIQGAFAETEAELPSLRKLLEATYHPGPAAYIIHMAELLLMRGRGELAEAIDGMQDLRTRARDTGNLQMLVDINEYLAEALMEAGQTEQAEAALQEAIAIADRGAPDESALLRGMLSMVRLEQGAIADARSLLAKGREQTVGHLVEVWLSWPEARLAAAEGHWPEALAAFQATADGLARMGMRWWRARILREWAEAHLARGEPDDRKRARELLRDAGAHFEAMGVPFYAVQVEERLKELERHS